MTDTQKLAINQKDEAGLRQTISIMTATNHKDKEEIIAYCEERLDHLKVDDAIVEYGEAKPGEFFQ